MQNYWNLDLFWKRRQFTGPLIIETFEKQAHAESRYPGARFLPLHFACTFSPDPTDCPWVSKDQGTVVWNSIAAENILERIARAVRTDDNFFEQI